jgi:hypothetical protein
MMMILTVLLLWVCASCAFGLILGRCIGVGMDDRD